MKLNIHQKLLLSILSSSAIVYLIAFGYLYMVMIEEAEKNAVEITREVAEKYANEVSYELNKDFAVTKALANSMQEYPALASDLRDDIYMPMLKETVLNNSRYMSVWYSWELSAIQPGYDKSYGRSRLAFFRQADISSFQIDTLNTEGDNLGSTYYNLKTNPRVIMVNPYYDNYTGRPGDSVKMTTIAVPFSYQTKFAGLIGVDINLSFFQRLTESIKPTDKSRTFIVAGDGNFVAFSDERVQASSYAEYFRDENTEAFSRADENRLRPFHFYTNKDGIEYYVSVLPIETIGSERPWLVGIMHPESEIFKSIRETAFIFIGVSLFGILLIIYVVWAFSKRITKPLSEITEAIDLVANGNISPENKPSIDSGDEIQDISRSVGRLVDNLNKTAKFATAIGKGNLSYEFRPLSRHDVLGNSLLRMRESLEQAEEERQIRQVEDEKLNWTNRGTAKFADIIREASDDIEKLSYSIISELVKYIGANQGGLFVINDENKNGGIDNEKSEKHIELMAAYAFDRKKHIQKRVSLEVGLLGRCVKEAETIYMTDIPSDYMHITSGLGKDNPGVLLLVPMMFNDEVFGVIEIASFSDIADYKRKFVEIISESIASSISRAKINMNTAKLLEDTQIKSKEMAAQEEEIRQNMEEMKSAQEELSGKITELDHVLDAIKRISFFVEYDTEGRIKDINDRFLNVLKLSRENVIGKYQGSFSTEQRNIDEFNAFWDRLRSGMVQRFEQEIETETGSLHIVGTYTPVSDSDGNIYKVISISQLK